MDRDDRRRAGLLFALAGSGLVGVLYVGAALAPGYHVGTDAISDLGVTPETALLFNGTMVVVGALDVAAGYVFYRWHRRRWLFALFALAGVGTAAVGVFPSSTGAAHAAAALVAFVGFNLQTAGSATRVAGPLRPLGLGAGALGLVALAWFVGGGGSPAAYGALGYGGVERLVVYPGVLWTVALCGALLGRLRGEPKH